MGQVPEALVVFWAGGVGFWDFALVICGLGGFGRRGLTVEGLQLTCLSSPQAIRGLEPPDPNFSKPSRLTPTHYNW